MQYQNFQDILQTALDLGMVYEVDKDVVEFTAKYYEMVIDNIEEQATGLTVKQLMESDLVQKAIYKTVKYFAFYMTNNKPIAVDKLEDLCVLMDIMTMPAIARLLK